jgi:alpha-1,3/alpha-1,6-mannosyltransferase
MLHSALRFNLVENQRTGAADVILVNSRFTARVFRSYLPSIRQTPTVIYPGINTKAYESAVDESDPDIIQVLS